MIPVTIQYFSPHTFLNSVDERTAIGACHQSTLCLKASQFNQVLLSWGLKRLTKPNCHESTPCQNISVVLLDVALHLKRLVKFNCLVSTLCLRHLYFHLVLLCVCSRGLWSQSCNYTLSDSICRSVRCYSVSEEACGACSVFTLCWKALIVPLGVTHCLKRLVELVMYLHTAWRHL